MVSIPYLRGGDFFWTCVKGNIIEGKDQYESIVIRGFDYKLSKEEYGGGVQYGLDEYPYFKHQI